MPASEEPGRRASGLRVLLVEDENLVALLLEDMLAELGHTVVGPVARLDRALETAQLEAFDVAILDVNIDGEESRSCWRSCPPKMRGLGRSWN